MLEDTDPAAHAVSLSESDLIRPVRIAFHEREKCKRFQVWARLPRPYRAKCVSPHLPSDFQFLRRLGGGGCGLRGFERPVPQSAPPPAAAPPTAATEFRSQAHAPGESPRSSSSLALQPARGKLECG